MRKIKLYTSRDYLSGIDYEPILFPFWGKCPSELEHPLGGQYEKYIQNGRNYFELSPIEECDFVLWPESYQEKNFEKVKALAELAQKYGKSIIIFFNNDSSKLIDIPNAYIFRTSMYKSEQRSNEFSLPCWSEDLFNYSNQSLPLTKGGQKPIVCYCGYTKTIKDRIKDILGRDYGIWRGIRYKAVKKLKHNHQIDTRFIIRNDFWGGAYKKTGGLKPEEAKKVRTEYANNLISGDYALVTRGNGNFSFRFYEIFSLGRIPVFINTDACLPFEEFIDYKSLCVWVELEELKDIDKKLINYHRNIDLETLARKQKLIRQIWEEWLSPDGFFKNFYRFFNLEPYEGSSDTPKTR
jgi:hypothetical protein